MARSRALPLALGLLLLLAAAPATAERSDGPALGSVHALAFDFDTGEQLYAKHSERVVPIASITKLMTALVVVDSGEPLDEWLTVEDWHRQPAANAYSRIRIGSKLRRRDLLRIALISSENRAAYTLARAHPGGHDAFIEAMNAKASELGMANTRFVDPSGLSDDNVSTAADLVHLMRATRAREPIVAATRTSGEVVHFRQPQYSLGYRNTNLLVHRRNWEVGLSKTGYLDAAGRCLVMTTRMDGRRVGVVLLDSLGKRTPVGDVGRLRDWLETGRSGPIADAARRYERERAAAYSGENQQAAGTP